MLTLAQAALLSEDVLRRGVIETIITDNPIYNLLPFMEISGNSYKYNLEDQEADSQFYQDNDEWEEGTATHAQRETGIVILGGDADVSRFQMKTRSNVNDIKAESLEKKAKAIGRKYQFEMLFGGTTTTPTPNGFDGMLKLIAECESTATTDLDGVNNSQVLAGSATSATVTLTMLDELCAKTQSGNPNFMLMSKKMLAKVTSLARAGGGNLTYTTLPGQMGMQVPSWQGVPIFTSSWLKDNFQDGTSSVLDIGAYVYGTTRASGYDNSVIITGRFGSEGFCGLQNGGLDIRDVGELQKKPAFRYRFEWYCGFACFTITDVAVLINSQPDAA